MKLNEISDNPGATKNRKRVGRGIGSGTGKTSGSGHKGQKARSGVSINGFEGGQMPIHRRLPKRGFNNARFRTEYVPVNLSDLEKQVEDGATVDVCTLKTAGLANGGGKVLVKILGNGKLTKKLTVTAHKFSGSAQKAIEAAGGTCQALNVPKPAPEAEAPVAE